LWQAVLLALAWTSAGAQTASPLHHPRPEAVAAPRVLTIQAMDYAFRAPSSVPAGVTTIRLVNRGTQLHHVQLNRLEGGRSVQDMLREWKPGVPLPIFMTGDGGPTAALGGQTLEGTVVLRPGRYALICWVPAPDGQLHVHKGMFTQLEVTGVEPGTPAVPALPRADVSITMLDYGYHLPRMRAGRQVIRVFNAGPQAHELVMVRLAPGAQRTGTRPSGPSGDRPGQPLGRWSAEWPRSRRAAWRSSPPR
jgi:hypothetical protein